jgi:hypothetical protein
MADELIPGTAEPDSAPAPEAVAPESEHGTPEVPTAEQFIDPRDLPPDVQPHFKRMQAAFTKKMQKLSADLDKVGLVDKFRSDPEFARQLITQESQRLGLSIQAASMGQQQPQAPRGAAVIPQQFVDAVAAELPSELQWMAPAIARATYSGVAQQTRPMLQENQQRIQAERETEWESLASQLSERQPGWEVHEDDMLGMLNFFQSSKLKHPVYGSKLDLLLNLVTGNAAATQRAITRMSDAGRSRTTTGVPGRTTVPNIADRVRKAPSNNDAWAEAAKAAVAQIAGGQGGA